MSLPQVADVWNHSKPRPYPQIYMGLELEVENYTYDYGDRVLQYWNIIEDHSLRNHGAEFVLSSPQRGRALYTAIDELSCYIEGKHLELSHRCSLHVHIDARTMTIEDIEKIYRLYVLFEPALYHVGQKERYENIYCPGMTHATEQIKEAAQAFSVKKLEHLVYSGCKYTGFNFLTLDSLGTLEIRTHSGSLRGNEIQAWVRVLQAIIKYAKDHTLEEIKALAHLTAESALREVWDDWELFQIVSCPSLYRYWENAKLNLLYMDMIDKLLLLPDDSNRQQNRYNLLDMNILNAAVEAALEENG